MSYYSNLSPHPNSSYTSLEPQQPSPLNPNGPPSATSSSFGRHPLRSSSSKLSLSLSASDRASAGIGSTIPSSSEKAAVTPISKPGNHGSSYGIGGGPTPLRQTWVFWFRQAPPIGSRAPSGKPASYEEGIKKVAAFSSVESFWSLQTHLNSPSSLMSTTDYMLFHEGVRRPIWEDPLNANGGKWIIRLRKGVSDRLWEDLILAVIGDQFEPEDGICGCVLSVRSNEDILSVWNRDDKDAEVKARIREGIRRLLGLPPSIVMEYKSNNDSMNDKSSFRTTSTQSISTLAGLDTPSTPS